MAVVKTNIRLSDLDQTTKLRGPESISVIFLETNFVKSILLYAVSTTHMGNI